MGFRNRSIRHLSYVANAISRMDICIGKSSHQAINREVHALSQGCDPIMPTRETWSRRKKIASFTYLIYTDVIFLHVTPYYVYGSISSATDSRCTDVVISRTYFTFLYSAIIHCICLIVCLYELLASTGSSYYIYIIQKHWSNIIRSFTRQMQTIKLL